MIINCVKYWYKQVPFTIKTLLYGDDILDLTVNKTKYNHETLNSSLTPKGLHD